MQSSKTLKEVLDSFASDKTTFLVELMTGRPHCRHYRATTKGGSSLEYYHEEVDPSYGSTLHGGASGSIFVVHEPIYPFHIQSFVENGKAMDGFADVGIPISIQKSATDLVSKLKRITAR